MAGRSDARPKRLAAPRRARLVGTAFLAAALAACGGGGDDGPPPVFSVTLVDMTGPYNAAAMRFGDVRYETPVLVAFGEDLGGKLSPAIEYIVVPFATVRASAGGGTVSAVEFNPGQGDFEVRVSHGGWLVIYDHLLNVVVSVGDPVGAGDTLGEAGNWSPTARRVELQINDPSGVSRCPLEFATADFAARHEALRLSVNAQGFGPIASLCLTDTVDP